MPLRYRLSTAVALVAALATAGCATMGRTNVPPHPVTITINNNLHLPVPLTVYDVTTGGGFRILGNATPLGSTSFQITPIAFSQPYRLLAQTPDGRRIWSEEFTVRDADTSEIVWSLVPNILAFHDLPDSATTTATTP